MSHLRESCMTSTSQVFMPYVRQAVAACHTMAHLLQAKHLELESEQQQLQGQLQEARKSTQQLQGEVERMEPELQRLQQQLQQMQAAKQEAEARVQDLSSELEVSQAHLPMLVNSLWYWTAGSAGPYWTACKLLPCREALRLIHFLA